MGPLLQPLAHRVVAALDHPSLSVLCLLVLIGRLKARWPSYVPYVELLIAPTHRTREQDVLPQQKKIIAKLTQMD